VKSSPEFRQRIEERKLAPPPWPVTDDTIMTISVVETLERCGEINRDFLARQFAERYRENPHCGYSATQRSFLRQLSEGVGWPEAARETFNGAGSMGNGAAMRVAPIGAYFADRLDDVVEQADRSAEVTHTHPEGKAGAIAVALAAAWAANGQGKFNLASGADLLAFCAEHTPEGLTQEGICRARKISFAAPADHAMRILGNGSEATAPDTVPFALWCAAKHLNHFAKALWCTASGRGDCDTNCAIVGGIVALSADETIPADWLTAREPLPLK
jgi:ADP-ribosylglycohydrolase